MRRGSWSAAGRRVLVGVGAVIVLLAVGSPADAAAAVGKGPVAGWVGELPGVSSAHGGRGVVPATSWASLPVPRGGAAAAGDPGRRVNAFSDARSTSFVTSTGEVVTRFYSQPVNFRSAGSWQPIDDSLQWEPGGYRNTADRYRLDLPSDLGSGPVKVSAGGGWVTLALRGASGTASVAGTQASYRHVLPSLSVSYAASGQGVKEDLLLDDTAAPQSVVYDVAASAGMRAARDADGSITIGDGSGDAFVLPAPVAQLADGTSRPVAWSLASVGDGWTLTLDTSAGWLRTALAAGAVSIDPTVTTSNVAQDCTLDQGAPSTSECTATSLGVGSAKRSLLQFDVSGLPKDAMVLNAKLGLYLDSTAANRPVGAYEVTRSWTNSATWNTADGTTAWTTAGGDFQQPTPAVSNASVGATAGWNYWYPTVLVQQWLADSAANSTRHQNHGLLLKDDSGGTTGTLGFRSGEYSPTGYAPYLQVSWSPRAGATKFYTFDSVALSDRNTLAVNVANGNVILHSVEAHTASTGPDLSIERWYNSALDNVEWMRFGRAGSLSPQACLRVYGDGSVAMQMGDGSWFVFLKDASGNFTTPTGIDASLTPDSSHAGEYDLSFHHSGVKWHFNLGGYQVTSKDRYGNTTTWNYPSTSTDEFSSLVDDRGVSFSASYNTDDAITGLSDSTGRSWGYTYGGAGGRQLATATDADNDTWSYGYGSDHKLASMTDPLGNVTTLDYDSQGRVAHLIRTTNASHTTGPTTTFTYADDTRCSTSGLNTTKVKIADGDATIPGTHTTTYCSNNLDEVIETYDASGHHRSATYTPSGNAATMTSPTGQAQGNAVKFDYDTTLDNLQDVDAQLDPTTTPTKDVKTSLDYTGSGQTYQPHTTTDPDSKTTTFGYDSAGGVTSQSMGSDPTDGTYTHRNSLGQIDYVVPPKQMTSTPTSVPSSQRWNYTYDTTTHTLSTVTPPVVSSSLGSTSFTYDSLHRVKTATDGLGHVATYTYDNEDRVKQIDWSTGTTSTVNTYDADGNLTARSTQAGSTAYVYDALNRLSSQTISGRTTSYTYDDASDLRTLTDPGGTVTYSPTATNKLDNLVEPGSKTVTFTYDDDDTRSKTSVPGGVDITTHVDHAGRLDHITAATSSSTLQSFTYVRDYSSTGSGTPDRYGLKVYSVTDENGRVTTYGYDGHGRLTSAVQKNSGGTTLASWTYDYDPDGNITRIVAPSGTTTYAYDNADELCWSISGTATGGCASPPTGATTYTYDAAGELTATSGSGLAASYNARHQTATVTPAGGSAVTLGYDGPGQQELSLVGTDILQNDAFGLSRVRHSSTSSVYLTRDTDGNPIGERTPDGTHHYYITDQLGSITGLLNDAGSLTDTYSYGPYGTTDSTSGSTENPLRFAGAYKGPGDLYHFGARWYDPVTARWIQPDPIDQSADLMQANRYGYAAGDPVDRLDPAGRRHDRGRVLRWSGSDRSVLRNHLEEGFRASERLFWIRIRRRRWM
jgi:RHS repeat-associated protein